MYGVASAVCPGRSQGHVAGSQENWDAIGPPLHCQLGRCLMVSATARPRVRFTTTDVLRMAEAGILDDRRVELLDGELIEMNPIGVPHARIARRLWRLVRDGLGERDGRDFVVHYADPV